ncbi:YadA-like family protein [Lonepinella sp. MS14435]|uniref:YadA-like family protein n=1 Tax=Lonepinella sp. MS14435 TaxID=3003618 RepID=UPI0036D9CFAE
MNVHKSSTIAQATSGSGKNSPMMRATSSSVSKSNAKAKFFAYNLFTSALILMSGQSFAGTGIYVNDGTDASCSVTFDGGSGGDIYTGMYSLNSSLVTSANRIDSGFTMKAGAADFIKYYYPQNSCLTSDKETQTYRTLFYGDANYSGSKHLTLGGRLDVNSGIIGVGNRGTNGTSATNSIRMGTGTSLNDTNDKNNAITIGVNSSASAESAVALGNTTTASGESTVAIGTLAKSTNYRAVAVGHNAQATGSRSTALGTESVASVESAVAIGDTSNASAKSALALGTSSVASGTDSAALGSRANATATSALAVGSTANATARNATAVGGQAQASGETSVALGTAANASKGNTVAVGASSSAAGDNAIAVGVKTTATTNSAIAIGNQANATGETSSIAIGRQSVASGTSSIAQGYKSSATVANSVALGSNSVASTAAGTVGTDPLSVASTTDLASTTWKSTYAAVSVGNGSTATRQITSVAAGTQDTDAVNVAQLKAAGFKLATTASAGEVDNSSTADKNIQNGETLTVDAGKNIKVTQTGQNVSIATKDEVEFTSVTAAGTKLSSAGLTFVDSTGTQVANSPSITATGINAGNNKITNVANGTGANDAVNFSQLQASQAASKEDVKSTDKTVTVTKTQGADNSNIFDLSVNVDGTSITKNSTTGALQVNTTTLTTTGGKVDTPANTNALATASDIANAINNSGFTAKANSDSGELITAGEEVNFINGENIAITRDGSNFTVATAKNVTFDNVTVGGVKVDGTTNKITGLEAGTANTDAVNVGQLNKEVAASKEAVITSDSALKVTTSTNTTTGANIYDIAVNTVALTTGTNGSITAPATADEGKLVTAKDVASAINNAGFTLKTSANGGKKDTTSTTDELINAGEVIDLAAGKNLTVKQEADGKVTYSLADEITLNKVTTGNTVMDTNGITIAAPTGGTTTDVKLTNSGLDNGNNKITNVANGTGTNDAVNFSQLQASKEEVKSDDKSVKITQSQNTTTGANIYDLSVAIDGTTVTKDASTGQLKANTVDFTIDTAGKVTANTSDNALATAGDIAKAINGSGFTAKANSDSGELITAGEEVNFINGDNIAITRSGSNFTVATTKDVTFNSVSVGNVKVDGTTNKITGLEAGTDANDAVNVQQLTDELAIIDDAIAASQEEVTTSDSALKVTTSTNTTTGANIYDIAINSVALATDSNGKVTAPTTADAGKLVTAENVASAINNAGFTLKTSANGGTKDATSTADELINAGDVIDLVAGKNLTVKQEANGTVTYALAKEIDLNKVTTGNTVMDTNGITIAAPTGATTTAVKLTNTGLDNGGNKITNVAAGTDENDAVNVGQLTDELAIIDDAIAASQEEVTSNDKSVTIATTQNADGANVFDLSVNVDDTTITKDATTGQLKANTVNFTTDAKGSVTANTNPNSLATAGDIANAINSSGFTAKANGDSGELITAGEEVNFINGDNIAITRSGSNFTVATTKDVTFNSVSVGNVKVDGTTNKITGLEAGTDANDAVNVQQLTDELAIIDDAIAASQEEVTTSDSALTVTTSTNATTGANIYDIAINSVALATDTNGKVTAPDAADEGKLVTAKDVASAINNAGFTLKTSANGGTKDATSTADELINAGDVIDLVAGKNLTVKQEANGTVTYATKNDVNFTTVTTEDAAGNKTVTSGTGIVITPNTGNAVSLTGNGLDNGGNKITNVAAGTDENDAVNVGQLTDELAIIDDAIAASQEEVTSNDKSVTIATTQNADGANVFDLSVNVDDTTITKDATTGQLKANTVNFTTDAKGSVTANTNPNSLATAGDIANAINSSGFTAKANSDAGELITAGEEVNFVNGNNIEITRQGSNFTVATAKDVKFDNVTVGNVKVDGTTNKITGLEAGTDANDAVNVQQLTDELAIIDDAIAASQEEVTTSDSALKVTTSTNTTTGANIYDIAINSVALATDSNGKVTAPTTADAGKLVTAENVASAINNAGFTLKTSANGGTKDATSTADELINAGDVIDLVAGKNLTVKQEANGTVTYALAKEIDLNKVTTGNTVMDTNGITIAAPTGATTTAVKLTNTGLDNGGNKITNVAAGTDENDAVNVGQLTDELAIIDDAIAASQEEVTSNDKSVTIATTQNADGANVFDLSVNVDDTTITKDATTGQLKANTVNFTTDAKGSVTANTNPNSLATAGDIAKAINSSGFTAKANGDAGELITAGKEVNFINGDNIAITRSGSNFTVATTKDVKFDSVTVGNVKVDGTTNKITGLEAGTDANDAVNVQQLTDELAIIDDAIAASQEEVTTSDSALKVTTSTNTTTGANIYDIAINSVALATDSNGKVTAPTTADAGKLVTAENVASAINNAGFTLKTSANGGTKDATSTADELINAGDVIDLVAGKNLTVKQEANGTVTYATKNDVNFTTVTTEDAAGNKTVTSGTGIVITPNTGNAVSLTGNGLDNGGNKITNVAAGTDENDAVNVGQLTDELAIIDDAIAASQEEVTSNDKSVTIATTQNADGANVFDLSVNVDDTTITKDATTGQLKANTVNFTTDAKGSVTANTNPNSLATAGDIANAINSSGFTAKANGDSGELITAGEEVNFINGDNIAITRSGSNFTVATTKNVTFNSVSVGNVKVDGTTNKITGLTAGTADTDAVNVGQLNKEVAASKEEVTTSDSALKVTTSTNATTGANIYDIAINSVALATDANGKITAPTTADAGKLVTAENVASAINNAGFTLKTSANGGEKISGDDEIINAGDEINLAAGKNLTVQQNTQGQVIFSTAENVEFTTVTAGGTRISSAGLTFVDPFTGVQKGYSPSITATGINAGGTKITNVEAGVDDTDAVNVGQLSDAIALLDESIAASQEEVKSTDNSVKVTTTKNTDQANVFDLSVNVDEKSITKDSTGALQVKTTNLTTITDGKVDTPTDTDALATAANVADAINNAGFTLKTSANGGTKDTASTADELINAGEVIDLAAGKNLTVKQEADGKVTYSLADEIDLNKVTTGNTVMDTNGITITAPAGGSTTDVKLTNTGLDNGGNKITNVAAGTDANDAVNVSQLQAAQAASKETVTSDEGSIVVGVKTDQTTGANIFDLSVNVDDKTITKDSTGALQVNTMDLTVTDGKVATPTDTNALATAANVADAINKSGFTLKTSATADGKKTSGSDELINPSDTIEMVAGKNLTVTQEADGKITYATADKVGFEQITLGDATNNTVLTSTEKGLDVGGDKITNVANGDISPTSTDAINGSQLSNTTKSIADALGGSSTVNTDGTITAPTYTLVSGNPAQNSTKAYYSVGNALNALNTAVNAPLTFAADSGNNVERQLGSTLNINGDAKNITTTTTSNGVTVALNDNISVKSVSVENGPTINSSGIQMANQQITGLKSGLDGTTIEQVAAQGASSPTWNNAATVGDLAQVQNNVVNSNNRINQLNDKINNVDKKLRAGVAGALATSGLPQAYIPGKSMVAIAAGSFKGENALAVGATRISDNGKVVLKLTGNTNTRGDVGTSVGLGYQW